MTMPQSNRYDFLDWLRVIAIFVLLFFHTGMLFVGWGWHITNAETIPGLQLPMDLAHRLRMPLLFVIAGAGMWFALAAAQRQGIRRRAHAAIAGAGDRRHVPDRAAAGLHRTPCAWRLARRLPGFLRAARAAVPALPGRRLQLAPPVVHHLSICVRAAAAAAAAVVAQGTSDAAPGRVDAGARPAARHQRGVAQAPVPRVTQPDRTTGTSSSTTCCSRCTASRWPRAPRPGTGWRSSVARRC